MSLLKLVSSLAGIGLVAAVDFPWAVKAGVDADLSSAFSSVSRLPYDGLEIIIPIHVEDPADADASNLLGSFNSFLSNLESHHSTDYVYEATHVGKDTDYYTQDASAVQKGWNAVTSANGFDIIFEGDINSCAAISSTCVAGGCSGPVSNNICNMGDAREWCHRHGGELLVLTDYIYYYILKPMTADPASYDETDSPNYFGAHISANDYWVNLFQAYQNCVGSAATCESKMTTTARFHPFNKLDSANMYTGWDSAGNEGAGTITQDLYDFKLTSELPDSAGPWHEGTLFLQSIFDLAEASNPDGTGVTASAIAYAAEVAAQGSDVYNMEFLSQFLNDLAPSQNLRLQVPADGSDPKIIDEVPDQNNVRPLCIIADALRYNSACPSEIGIDSMCGDEVRKFVFTTIYGQLASGAAPAFNDDGSGSATSFTAAWAAIVANLQNEVIGQALTSNTGLSYIPQGVYINCMGTYNDADGTWDASALFNVQNVVAGSIFESRTALHICEGQGFVYDSATELTSTTSGTGADNCPCTCDTPLTWTDVNGAVTVPAVTGAATGSDTTFCCNSGFDMHFTAPFAYTTTIIDGKQCGIAVCHDLTQVACDSTLHDTPFWSTLAGNVNNMADFFDSTLCDSNSHDAVANNVQATCEEPPACQCTTAPPAGPSCYGAAQDTNVANIYENGFRVTYIVDNEHCGTFQRECSCTTAWDAVTATSTVSESWVDVGDGACNAKMCTPPTADVNGAITPLTNLDAGEDFTATCNNGFVLGAGDPLVTCDISGATDTCDTADYTDGSCCLVASAAPPTCEPCTCNAPTNVIGACWETADTGTAPFDGAYRIEYTATTGSCGTWALECTCNLATEWTVVGDDSCTNNAKTCSAPADIDNGSVTAAAVGDGFDVTCDTNFALVDVNGATVAGNAATIACGAAADTTACTDPGADCCIVATAQVYSCAPVTCVNANPCGGLLINNPAVIPATFNIGDIVNCECHAALQQGNDACLTTCTLDAATNTGVFSTGHDCQCSVPECPFPMDIPHGSIVDVNGIAFAAGTTTIAQDEFVSYTCDSGYELTFTHDDAAATSAQCLRQCYAPATELCEYSPEDGGHGYGNLNPIAVLDVLNCYCKPVACDAFTLPAGYEYISSTAATTTYFPMTNYDSLDVTCADGFMNSNAGTDAVMTVTCSVDAGTGATSWTSPGTCVSLGCANPRTAAGSAGAWSLNTAHTCSSLDAIKLPGEADFVDLASSTATFADGNALLGLPMFHNDAFDPFLLEDDNVGEGSWARFTCRKGFSAYYNAHCAAAMNMWGAGLATNFDCQCVNGRWMCQHECRCESYCVVEEFSVGDL